MHDIEFVRLAPGLDLAALEPFLDTGAELGARQVICAPYDPDRQRVVEHLAALAERCAARGLGTALEFFPRTPVAADLAAAARIVEASGAANAGVLLDALHFDRSPSTLETLERMPSALLPFVHLCDAPVRPPYTEEALLHAARCERLPPGEGEIDLSALLARLSPDCTIALEVPMARMTATQGPEAVAGRVRAATTRLLERVAAERSEASDDGRPPEAGPRAPGSAEP